VLLTLVLYLVGSYICTLLQEAEEKQKEMTLEDMYKNDGTLYDDDEDDSDWEPVKRQVELMRWFCTNCTMVNVEDVFLCDVRIFFMLKW